MENKQKKSLFSYQIKFLNRVKQKEVVVFSRQLSVLFSAKVPLVESLRILSQQSANPYFKKIVNQISAEIEGGSTLSKALSPHHKIFSELYVNLIKAGEVSGNLENALNYLAEHLEKQYRLVKQVKSAMAYPLFILAAFAGILVLMLTMVIPQLTVILEESGQELPSLTKLVIALSDFLRNSWLALLIVLIFAIGGIWRLLKTKSGRKFWDTAKLKLPIFGKLFQKIYLARLADNFGVLLKGGIPILQSLEVSAEAVGNEFYKKVILEAKEQIRGGGTISSVFFQYNQIPPMFSQMIAVGEKTGQIDFILQKLSHFYTQEVETSIAGLSQLLEPILIVGLGIMVGILVGAILMPIYNIAGGM